MSRCPEKNRHRALLTGITGQDGSYLTELLLSRGYEVWGLIIRRLSSFNTLDVRLHLLYGDVTDACASPPSTCLRQPAL